MFTATASTGVVTITTTKDIISPITNIISQLTNRNNEAEKNNSAIEDISEYSSLVVEQIQNFITNIVLNIIRSQEFDEKLKDEMYDGKLIGKKKKKKKFFLKKKKKKKFFLKKKKKFKIKTNIIIY